MKIVVIGGSGLIGRQLVPLLQRLGHDVLAASPRSGVNAVTGEGLAGALAGAAVVVDVANSPSFEDRAVLEFFEKSSRNLLAAERDAGVGHHVALSVVGAERLPDSGYMRAKMAQEALIQSAGVPYTILRATQFFEFLEGIAGSSAAGDAIHLTSAPLQPVASADVAAALADVAVSPPVNGTLELAGADAIPLDELVRRYFVARRDGRAIVTDREALYFGAKLDDRSLVPGDAPRIGAIRFEDWLRSSVA